MKARKMTTGRPQRAAALVAGAALVLTGCGGAPQAPTQLATIRVEVDVDRLPGLDAEDRGDLVEGALQRSGDLRRLGPVHEHVRCGHQRSTTSSTLGHRQVFQMSCQCAVSGASRPRRYSPSTSSHSPVSAAATTAIHASQAGRRRPSRTTR